MRLMGKSSVRSFQGCNSDNTIDSQRQRQRQPPLSSVATARTARAKLCTFPTKSSGSWISGGIWAALFWCLYAVAQCGLLHVYHSAALRRSGVEIEIERERVVPGNARYTNGNSKSSNKSKSTNEQSRYKDKPPAPPTPDGIFNGYPIYKLRGAGSNFTGDDTSHSGDSPAPNHKNNANANANSTPANKRSSTSRPLYSQFHCAGETWKPPVFHRRSNTWHEESWKYRSCRFQFLCFDTEQQEYVLFLDPNEHPDTNHEHIEHISRQQQQQQQRNPRSESGTKTETMPHHPNPSLQKILRKQREQVEAQERKAKRVNANAKANSADIQGKKKPLLPLSFKQPSLFDDTSTVYRNLTSIVDGKGDVTVGDVINGKHYGVSIGSMNGKWGLVDGQRLKWFPRIEWGGVPLDVDVYTLPSSVVVVPFHSLSASNPGHLVWDDFLPMYTLLDMFGLLHTIGGDDDETGGANSDKANNTPPDLLPIRYILPPGPTGDARGLWAGCDWLDSRAQECHAMLQKFGTLLGTRRSYKTHGFSQQDTEKTRDGVDASKSERSNTPVLTASKMPKIPITTNRDVELRLRKDYDDNDWQQISQRNTNTNGDSPPLSPTQKRALVCARNGLAGFGAISDHGDGSRSHGWEENDYKVSYNQGRGGKLWDFRNFMIRNLYGENNANSNGSNFVENENATAIVRTTFVPAATASTTGIHERDPDRRRVEGITQGGKEEQRPYYIADSVFRGIEEIGGHQREQQQQNEWYPPASITEWGPDEPLVVLFSSLSSKTRRRDFVKEANDLRRVIAERSGPDDPQIIVETHKFSDYTLEKQIQMASRAAVFVTFCGGGAITASFLPKGASVQIYYNEKGGIRHNIDTQLPARLDWDFFNNAGYLHVQWLPVISIDKTRRQPHKTEPNTTTIPGSSGAAKNVPSDLIFGELRRIHRERKAFFLSGS
ncbi:unnamed protein product [Pseudo-nitzschia multistriata]|uniref:Uncharacterized protein n=1 Tax=Pseudo-nitzschia multistriata TaxID=183589 RepID=A0A448YWG1_9STRA|nr:unnamed protein product [Pseudo-nitzschia multistriata]